MECKFHDRIATLLAYLHRDRAAFAAIFKSSVMYNIARLPHGTMVSIGFRRSSLLLRLRTLTHRTFLSPATPARWRFRETRTVGDSRGKPRERVTATVASTHAAATSADKTSLSSGTTTIARVDDNDSTLKRAMETRTCWVQWTPQGPEDTPRHPRPSLSPSVSSATASACHLSHRGVHCESASPSLPLQG